MSNEDFRAKYTHILQNIISPLSHVLQAHTTVDDLKMIYAITLETEELNRTEKEVIRCYAALRLALEHVADMK